MALSGSFSGSIRSGNYRLRVDWAATQSVSGNYSKITCVMYLVQASGWSLSISSRSDNVTVIAGAGKTWSSPAISNGGGKTTKLATVTSGNIAHNADGSKSVAISATFEINATISGTYYDKITASTTVTLDTIPRATAPKLSATSATMGGTVTISMPRASSSFTHDLAYKGLGADWTTITTGAGTSYTWTVPNRSSSIPNATSGTLTVRCTTKNGSTTVGSKSVTLTAKVPASVVPTISGATFVEAVSGLASQFGAFVQGKSKAKATITAAGASGSTIKTITSTLQGKSYTGASWTSDVLSRSGTYPVSVVVKDSRGRSASKSYSITVQPYTPPTISTLDVYRCDSSGTPQDDGTSVWVSWRFSASSVGGKNTVSALLEYKRTTESTWQTMLGILGQNTESAGVISGVTLSTDYQYDIRLTVTDFFGSQSRTAILPTGRVILDLKADGTGLAIGKASEKAGLELAWPVDGQQLTTQTQAGQYKTFDGLLLQWGTVNITPTEAGVATTEVVRFPIKYSATPTVLATPISSVPGSLSVSVQRGEEITGGDNTAAVAVTLVRSGTTSTGINWLAIGPA